MNNINIHDLYLIIAQLTLDLNQLEEQHEKLAQLQGGGKEAREEVYASFMGPYMKELNRIISILQKQAVKMEDERASNTITTDSALA